MTKVKTIELDKEKIMRQLIHSAKLMATGKWRLEYDRELDQLFVGKKIIPKNAFLYGLNDEINIFVTPASNVNGLFIEYFAKNYIKHNKKLSPVLEALAKVKKKKDKEKEDLAKEALEGKLVNEAITSVYGKKKLVAAIA